MSFLRTMRRLWRRRRWKRRSAFSMPDIGLRERTQAFCDAVTLSARTRRASGLFAYIWTRPTDRGFIVSLLRFIRLLEQDKQLRASFDAAWQDMLSELNSIPLFADAGLPASYALLHEAFRRLFQRLLPSAREESDTARLFTAVFASRKSVERFLYLDNSTFIRLARILWPRTGLDAVPHVGDAVRQRGSTHNVEGSPFYQLVFATEGFLQSSVESDTDPHALERWFAAVHACRNELIQVR